MPNDITPLEHFYLRQEEPGRSCLLALRSLVMAQDAEVTHQWKYGMPFFCFRNRMFCYLWMHKQYGQPYLGIVEGKRLDHPQLLAEKRSRMKILLIDPAKDLPADTIQSILQQALNLYRNGTVKT